MGKLIDDEKLKARIDEEECRRIEPAWYDGLDTCREIIDEIPAVDAVPVVHGYWKGWTATHWNKRYQDNGDPEYVEHTYYSCSKCRRRTVIRENYCPNCGAKMDGERRESE